MELRTVACILITHFNIRLAPNEDGSSLIDKSTETFTLRMGDLNLVFEERSTV